MRTAVKTSEFNRFQAITRPNMGERAGSNEGMTTQRSHLSKLDSLSKIDLVMRNGRLNESHRE